MLLSVGQVENNLFCQEVLKARMKNQCLHRGAVYPDVRKFSPGACGLANRARGVIGGFPCQAGCPLDHVYISF